MVAFSVLCTNSPIQCRKWLLKVHDAVLDIDEADSLIGCGAFVLKKGIPQNTKLSLAYSHSGFHETYILVAALAALRAR